jgi:hypothetical protein
MELEPPNKGMKLTSAEHIGRSQLIPGVRRTKRDALEMRMVLAVAAIGAAMIIGSCANRRLDCGAPDNVADACDATLEWLEDEESTSRAFGVQNAGPGIARVDSVSVTFDWSLPGGIRMLRRVVSPEGWSASIKLCPDGEYPCEVTWAPGGESVSVPPGQSLRGFRIEFSAAPGAVRSWAVGFNGCGAGGIRGGIVY